MIGIEATVETEVDRILRGLEQTFPSRELMLQVGDLVSEQTEERIRFDRRNPETGQPWADWSEAYRRAGAPFTGRHTLLRLTGDLERSISMNARRDSVDVGPTVDYAPAHQHGIGRMPERAFLGVGKKEADELCDLVASQVEFLIERMARA